MAPRCPCRLMIPGMMYLPARSVTACAGGFQLRGGSHPCDPAVIDNHGGICDGRAAVAIDQREIFEYFDFSRRAKRPAARSGQQLTAKGLWPSMAPSRMRLARDGLKTPQEQNRAR